MICCNRTHERVTLSPNKDYIFYNATLDEDLYRFETYVKCSDEAKAEALEIIKNGVIPDNFSNNTELQAFVSNYLNCHHFHLDSFKKLEVLKQDKLEYDEAVLLSILYHE